MRRDLDLIRTIPLKLEEHADPQDWADIKVLTPKRTPPPERIPSYPWP